jgi:hypothetical protein
MSELLEIEEEYMEITEKILVITRRRLLAESTQVAFQVRRWTVRCAGTSTATHPACTLAADAHSITGE